MVVTFLSTHLEMHLLFISAHKYTKRQIEMSHCCLVYLVSISLGYLYMQGCYSLQKPVNQHQKHISFSNKHQDLKLTVIKASQNVLQCSLLDLQKVCKCLPFSIPSITLESWNSRVLRTDHPQNIVTIYMGEAGPWSMSIHLLRSSLSPKSIRMSLSHFTN